MLVPILWPLVGLLVPRLIQLLEGLSIPSRLIWFSDALLQSSGADTSQLLRYQLKWLTSSYPSPGGIYITEFGFVEPVSIIKCRIYTAISHHPGFQYESLRTELYQITWDAGRSDYLLDYLNEALLAIHGKPKIIHWHSYSPNSIDRG